MISLLQNKRLSGQYITLSAIVQIWQVTAHLYFAYWLFSFKKGSGYFGTRGKIALTITLNLTEAKHYFPTTGKIATFFKKLLQ